MATPNRNFPPSSAKKRKAPSTMDERILIDLTFPSPPRPPKTPAKRQKTASNTNTPSRPTPEKRLKRFRDHPPQSLMVKHERVMTQRMFLVERSGRKDGALEEDFSVLGSTGNVYQVNLSRVPNCTCPDFIKNQAHCKHILFVLVKVLKLPDPLWYQAAFLTSELQQIFNIVEDRRHAVSSRVLQQFKSLTTGESVATEEEGPTRKPLEGDCPICFESLSEASLNQTVYCKAQCGNNIHKECFGQWARNKRAEGAEVSCVYCRARWDDGAPMGKGKGNVDSDSNEGYLNLGRLCGLSQHRDTSTYHYHQSWASSSSKGRRRYYGGFSRNYNLE